MTANSRANMIIPGSGADGRNRDYPWDEFNPVDYLKYNYVTFRDDDREIIEKVRDFFAETFLRSPLPPGARGIDVGTGANLYPALTMLPFCEDITLYEYSAANVEWLTDQRACDWPSWDWAWERFWDHLCEVSAYRDVPDPKDELTRRVNIVKADVFELYGQEPWDIGTMFFVAECITGHQAEFVDAVDRFFAALKPGAPFAMAFMEHSGGYHVGDRRYPATDVGWYDISELLSARGDNVHVHHVSPGPRPLRENYTGMIVAYGRVKRVPSQHGGMP